MYYLCIYPSIYLSWRLFELTCMALHLQVHLDLDLFFQGMAHALGLAGQLLLLGLLRVVQGLDESEAGQHMTQTSR